MGGNIRKFISRILVSSVLLVVFSIGFVNTIAADGHSHDGKTFVEWTSTNTLPSEAGNYYLANNVSLTSTWVVLNNEVNLCLNGKTITMESNVDIISVSQGSVLNIYDENGGVITHAQGQSDNGIKVNGGSLSVNGGTIKNNDKGINVSGGGTLNLDTASVTYNTIGIFIADGSTVNVKSGVVGDNAKGIYVYDGALNFSSGVVLNNSTSIEVGANSTVNIGSESDHDNDTYIVGAFSLDGSNSKVKI